MTGNFPLWPLPVEDLIGAEHFGSKSMFRFLWGMTYKRILMVKGPGIGAKAEVHSGFVSTGSTH